jgi:hypothetical protein
MTLQNKLLDINSSRIAREAKMEGRRVWMCDVSRVWKQQIYTNTDGEISVFLKTSTAKNVKQTAEY